MRGRTIAAVTNELRTVLPFTFTAPSSVATFFAVVFFAAIKII
jgi:hypothetical protein